MKARTTPKDDAEYFVLTLDREPGLKFRQPQRRGVEPYYVALGVAVAGLIGMALAILHAIWP